MGEEKPPNDDPKKKPPSTHPEVSAPSSESDAPPPPMPMTYDPENEKPKPNSEGTGSTTAVAVAVAANVATRTVNIGLAAAAASIMATATEITVVLPSTPGRTQTLSYHDFPSYRYLQVANTISAILALIAILLRALKKDEAKWLLSLIDAAVPALLDSATGAALFNMGNMSICAAPDRHVSVCAQAGTGNFCSQVNSSILLSLFSSIADKMAELAKNEKFWLFILSFCSNSSDDVDDGCGHGCSHQL